MIYLKMLEKFCFFFLLFSIFSDNLRSQEQTKHSKFYHLYHHSFQKDYSIPAKGNPLQTFYSKFISSQDHSDCPFYPSCSAYMFESVRNYGLIPGLIKGLDRLSRCNKNQLYMFELTHENKMIDLP